MTDLSRKGRSRGKWSGSPSELRNYTKQIWLAGLGAFSRNEEGAENFFDALVKAGEEIEGRTREAAGVVEEVREKVREKASGTLGRVERVLDDGLATTLGRIGIPSQRDIEAINARLDALTMVLDEIRAQLPKK